MAGLVAAARARELGATPSCSRRATARAARCCSRAASSGATASCESSAPSARAATRRCSGWSVERLDDALAWLESLGAEPVCARDREPAHDRPALRPARADRGCSCAAAGDVRLRDAARRRRGRRWCSRPAASGARLARGARACSLRANPWSDGRRAALALARGAALSAGHGRVLRPRTCRRRRVRRGATSCRSRSSTAATRASSTTTGEQISPARSRGPRTTSSRRRAAAGRARLVPSLAGRTVDRARSRPRERGRRRAAGGGAPFALPSKLADAVVAVHVRGRHAHDRRPARRRAGPRARADGGRSTASAPRAPTPAASRPAATRAGSPRRSSSAASPPRRCASSAELGRLQVRAARAGRRGSGDGAELRRLRSSVVRPSSTRRRPPAARPRARAARSRSASRRRAGSWLLGRAVDTADVLAARRVRRAATTRTSCRRPRPARRRARPLSVARPLRDRLERARRRSPAPSSAITRLDPPVVGAGDATSRSATAARAGSPASSASRMIW